MATDTTAQPFRSSSRSETRHEATTQIARDIMTREAQLRSQNTARLRAARLARDAAEAAEAPAVAEPTPKRRKGRATG